ncbi:hypothetical protein SBF1_750018 [Candidatus Desulfosporosinus infrequens]|uniref:Uncharacterized protein n=1 Tax=Candidatus Desulfosporosinus infrequens TaxID=2043169 RepID=A0A2U3LR10_9FIRM|nr:hypothetical protein SBF1_750018 [Candidatus Desulfosporosinus infrequens]
MKLFSAAAELSLTAYAAHTLMGLMAGLSPTWPMNGTVPDLNIIFGPIISLARSLGFGL